MLMTEEIFDARMRSLLGQRIRVTKKDGSITAKLSGYGRDSQRRPWVMLADRREMLLIEKGDVINAEDK